MMNDMTDEGLLRKIRHQQSEIAELEKENWRLHQALAWERATPAARKLAEERNIRLADVDHGGKICKSDVANHTVIRDCPTGPPF